MIQSKEDMKRFIMSDCCHHFGKDQRTWQIFKFVNDEEYLIVKYLEYLRKQEYYINSFSRSKIKGFMSLLYERKKNKIGKELGLYIPPNCFEEGLTIWHQGTVIVNSNAKIGKRCTLHGNNCIGNNGKSEECPVIGDDVDIGFGAVIIGDITIADNVKIGANSVVTKSIGEKGSTYAGVPAKRVK